MGGLVPFASWPVTQISACMPLPGLDLSILWHACIVCAPGEEGSEGGIWKTEKKDGDREIWKDSEEAKVEKNIGV